MIKCSLCITTQGAQVEMEKGKMEMYSGGKKKRTQRTRGIGQGKEREKKARKTVK